MPRVVGVDIPNNKKVLVALTYIFGIGHTSAAKICKDLDLDVNVRSKDLSEENLTHLAAHIEKSYAVEGHLRRQTGQNIQRLKEISCYRGLRHLRGLPVRGQQTQSNARTRKGPKKTVAGKKSIKRM